MTYVIDIKSLLIKFYIKRLYFFGVDLVKSIFYLVIIDYYTIFVKSLLIKFIKMKTNSDLPTIYSIDYIYHFLKFII